MCVSLGWLFGCVAVSEILWCCCFVCVAGVWLLRAGVCCFWLLVCVLLFFCLCWFWCVVVGPLFCVVLVVFGCGVVWVLLLVFVFNVFELRRVLLVGYCATLVVGVAGAFLLMVSCGFSRRFLFFGVVGSG